MLFSVSKKKKSKKEYLRGSWWVQIKTEGKKSIDDGTLPDIKSPPEETLKVLVP